VVSNERESDRERERERKLVLETKENAIKTAFKQVYNNKWNVP
jgi:hypothetical protein